MSSGPADQTGDVASRGRPRGLLWSLAIVAALLPFAVLHLVNLWQHRPHYQFFPAVLIGVGVLLWIRWPQAPIEQTRLSRLLAASLLIGGLVIGALAVRLFSPWLGGIAFVLALGGVLLRRTGRAGLTELLPVWLLLWLIIPPPWPLDDQAIRGLQQLTATCSSNVLEFIGVPHLLAGKVFRLPDRELFVAEACSGIHSQLVLVAAAAFFCVVMRRHWFHSLLLIAAAVFWSVAMNVVRVATVVLVAQRMGVDLSTGIVHDALGHVLLIVGFLLLLSTDQLLISILPLRWILNFEEEEVPAPAPAADVRPATSGRALPALTLCLFAAIGVLQLVWIGSSPASVSIDLAAFLDAFPQDCLPTEIGGWQQTSFETEERDLTSDAGRFSRIWHYKSGYRDAMVSVDFPFVGWHDLSRCYTARGWAVRETLVHEEDDWPLVEVEMTLPTGEFGTLFYCLVNPAGTPLTPAGEVGGHWRTRMEGQLPNADRLANNNETSVQFQQFLISEYRLLEQDRAELLKLFAQFRNQLRQDWLQRQEGR